MGASLASLAVACSMMYIEKNELRKERDELVVLVSRSLDEVEKSRETSFQCLSMLGEIRAKLGPITEAQPKPPLRAIGGPSKEPKAADVWR